MLSENEDLAKKKKEEGNLCYTQKNYSEAIEYYNEAIHYSPQMKESWFNKGVAYQMLNQFSEALTAFNEAIRLDPNYKKAIDNRNFAQAKILIVESKYQKAYKLLKQCSQTARVEFATIQSTNAFKAEIFFGRVDLKLTDKDEIKILQFGKGMQSGFMGIKQIYGKDIVEILKENLLSFRLPYLVADQPGIPPLNSFNGAVAFIEQHNIVERTNIDFAKISSYSGIYCSQKFEPKIYSNILAMGTNVSAAIIADDLLLTHQMFAEPQVQKYRPLTKVLPRKYSPNLSKQINKEIDSKVYMLRVPDVELDGGIWFASKRELDDILKFLLEENDLKAMELFCLYLRINNKLPDLHPDLINLFITWRSSNSRSFLVESYVHSKLIASGHKYYDPTMRVAFLIIRDNDSLIFRPMGAYWQLPKETIDHDDIRLRTNFAMTTREQNYLAVDTSDLNTVYQQLAVVLSQVFHNMFIFNFETYRQQLINSSIDNERNYGYYITTRMINEFGHQGYMAAALELLDNVKNKYHMPYKIYHERGLVYYNGGCYSKAIEQFSEGLKCFDNIASYYRRGLAYYALGMLDKALDDLTHSCVVAGLPRPMHSAAYEHVKQELERVNLCKLSTPTKYMSIDLHGDSVKKAKETVDNMLTRAKDNKVGSLTVVTGIGSHVNNDGTKGVLFKTVPKWLKKSSSDIKSIKQDNGAYEIQFNHTSDYYNKIKIQLEEKFSLLNKEQLKKLLEDLEQKSQQGDMKSKSTLGFMYIIGITVPQDIDRGLSIWIEAAENFIDLQVQLGVIYSSNHFPIKDYKKAIKWFLKAAEKDHPVALFELGKMYWLGCGVIKHDAKAIKYLTLAAECKLLEIFEKVKPFLVDGYDLFMITAAEASVSAAHNLGNIYFDGDKNIKQDPELAAKYYLLAAKANRVEAQVVLARQYFFGWGIKNNDNQAFFWFEKAALTGDVIAQYYVGRCYETGRGTICDLDQAAIWYKKAAAQGDLDAQFKIAYGYLLGVLVEQDIDEGLKQLRLLAEQDHSDSLYILGRTLIEKGKQQDIQSAIEYITRAAKLEQTDAQKLLARFCLKGNYCQMNKEQAIYWLREAAKQEDAEALLMLSVILKNKTPQDTQESIDCLIKSAQLGFKDAQIMLGLKYLKGNDGVLQNITKAIELLEQAAIQGSDTAQLVLAHLLQERGEKENLPKIIHWLTLAAQQGKKEAQYELGLIYLSKDDQQEDHKSFEAGLYWLYQAALQRYKDAITIFRKFIVLGKQEEIIHSLSLEYKLRHGSASFPNISELEEINCDKDLAIVTLDVLSLTLNNNKMTTKKTDKTIFLQAKQAAQSASIKIKPESNKTFVGLKKGFLLS